VVLCGLGASVLGLAVAPLVVPADYSWIAQTTSEAAAQGVDGAWLARLGFLLFGLAVVVLASGAVRRWGAVGVALHGAFGALMAAAAAFSHRPWRPGADFVRFEDLLHSVVASAMGVAFAAGVVTTAIVATRGGYRAVRLLDVTAVAASVILPVGMTLLPHLDGVLQRAMFAVAYAWYAREALAILRLPVSADSSSAGPPRRRAPFSGTRLL
jgi:hypothetical protein